MRFTVDGQPLRARRGRLDPLPHRAARTRGPTRPTSPAGRSGWRSAAPDGAMRHAHRHRARRQRAHPRRRARDLGRADGATRVRSRARVAIARARRATSSCSRTATARRSARSRSSRRAASREAPALPFDALDRDDPGRRSATCSRRRSRASTPTLPTATLLTRVARRPPTTRRSRRADQADRPVLRRGRGARGWPTSAAGTSAPDAGPRLAADGRRARGRSRCVEREQIELLAAGGVVVIAGGGGGIPVGAQRRRARGLDAVIDKDRCSTELAPAASAPTCSCCSPASPRVVVRLRHALAARHGAAHGLRRAAPPATTGEFPRRQHGPEDRGARRASSAGAGAP